MLNASLFRRLALAATVTALLVSVPTRSIHAQSPDAEIMDGIANYQKLHP